MSLQRTAPNTKSLRRAPIRVKGMQKTPSRRSDTDRLSRNTLVIVRMRWFCTRVKITSTLPTTANKNIREYRGICTLPAPHQSTPELVPDLDGVSLGTSVTSVQLSEMFICDVINVGTNDVITVETNDVIVVTNFKTLNLFSLTH